jgi:recombination protein RecA
MADDFLKLLGTMPKKYDFQIGQLDNLVEDAKFVTTGNLAIDYSIGGGIPLGRTIEFHGPPSSGKTTAALQVAAELQKIIIKGGDPARGIKPDDRILYLDFEQAMDKVYAANLGLDVNHETFLFGQPDTLEAGCNATLELLKTGRVRLVIIDSVAAMNPSAKAEAEIGKSLPAVAAKLLKDFGATLNSVLSNANASVIFINHLIEKFDMGGARRPGMPAATTTPGGIALKFFASVRVEFKQIRQNMGTVIDPLTNEEVRQPTSTDVKVKVVKNKVAPPFRECVVRVRLGLGFDNFWTALQILLANKKIMHEGGMYYFHNIEAEGYAPPWMERAKTGTHRPYIRGEANVFIAGDEDDVWREGLIGYARGVAADNVEALAAVAPLRRALEAEAAETEETDALDALLEVTPVAGRRVQL